MAYSQNDAGNDVGNEAATFDLTSDPDWRPIIARCGRGSVTEAIQLAYREALAFARTKIALIDTIA